MKKKHLMAFLLIGTISLYFYFGSLSGPKEGYQAYNYSVDEIYARHSFIREFKRFSFWDLISKEGIDGSKAQDIMN